ncbi:MAG TPA: glycosyltransferase, partial [Acidimicrobiales bacterium]|nr:glycosyltransferase [Acidimicrobiales bacterium]
MPEGRALQLVASDQRRGAETFAVDLAAALSRRGLDAPTVALSGSLQPDSLPIRSLGARALAPSTLRALRRLVHRGERIAAVVAHGSRTLPACALALAGTGVPFAYRSIGDPLHWSARGLARLQMALQLRRAALVTALWPGAADVMMSLHGVPADRIRVVPNGVPAARCPVPTADDRAAARARFGVPAGAAVVGYVGALTVEKCVASAVAAVARCRGMHLVVAGDGPEHRALEAQARADAPGRVTFAGVVPGARPVLAASDVLVLPSRSEGMPGVLIEAGLSGVPVVASAVGGVPEVVADGETGVLVPPGDEAALAAALQRVVDGGGAAH